MLPIGIGEGILAGVRRRVGLRTEKVFVVTSLEFNGMGAFKGEDPDEFPGGFEIALMILANLGDDKTVGVVFKHISAGEVPRPKRDSGQTVSRIAALADN